MSFVVIRFRSEIRTNNYVESFHATLLTQIGKHSNIWDFMRILILFYIHVCEYCFKSTSRRTKKTYEDL